MDSQIVLLNFPWYHYPDSCLNKCCILLYEITLQVCSLQGELYICTDIELYQESSFQQTLTLHSLLLMLLSAFRACKERTQYVVVVYVQGM